MELSDVNVKVVYDFEYTTKDGRQVKINEGEKLYLIKKTNEDWWQVIRNSGRPFYVPASYVQEINKEQGIKNKTDKYNTTEKMKIQAEMERSYRNRSCSVESQKTYDNHKHKQIIFTDNLNKKTKPVVPPRTYIDKISSPNDAPLKSKKSALRFSNPKNFDIKEENYPEQNEDDDEEADYVNLPSTTMISEKTGNQLQNRNHSDNSLSTSLSSIDSDKLSECNSNFIISSDSSKTGYSHVNIKTPNTLPLDNNNLVLKLTNSLEELSQEINQKATLINNSADFKTPISSSGYSKVSDIVKNITKDSSISSKNINNVINKNLKQVNNRPMINHADGVSAENDMSKSKLQYVGSFKTKHEREKWAKNYVLLTAMKEEEIMENQNHLSNVISNNLATASLDRYTEKSNPQTCDNNISINSISNINNNNTNNRICDDETRNKKSNNNNDDANVTVNISADNVKFNNNENNFIKDEKYDISKKESPLSDNTTVQTVTCTIKISDRISNFEEKVTDNALVKTSSEIKISSLNRKADNHSAEYENISIKNTFDSSCEELGQSPVYTSSIDCSRLSASDKGSTDSLLDVDNQLSLQDGSICTTASDSLLHTSDTSDEEFSKLLHEKAASGSNSSSMGLKKKPILSRNGRVESCRLRFPVRGVSPPVPEPNQQPTKELFGGWSEYTFADGRTFFYNCKTGEKSWKPPRRRSSAEKNRKQEGSISNLYSGSSSPLGEIDEVSGKSGAVSNGGPSPVSTKEEQANPISMPAIDATNTIPAGWRSHINPDNGLQYYINVLTGARWFSSKDEEGRVYYFKENSTESSWTLPPAAYSSTERLEDDSKEEGECVDLPVYTNIPPNARCSTVAAINNSSTDGTSVTNNMQSRSTKAKSLIILEPQKNEEPQSILASKNWPQLWDGHMCVLKEGTLNRTKITENGKRLRKNWTSSHVVLTELFLLFFKDAKSFAAMKTGGGRPEMCVDLNGALIDRGDKISSRRNVFIISTVLGLQVLIQSDCTQQADLWLLAIQGAIKNLPSSFDSCPRLTRGTIEPENISPEIEASKKFYKVTRSKSVKTKNKDGSIEDLTVSPAERQTKIKARLKKFFHRRPTVESLIKKGIWKDEAAFGCYLDQVCPTESPRVPLFVQRCITCIERSEENMKTDGLYRASGNLSQVQKIRLQVDQNNLSVIEEEEDVHVLTGALKLFFRELKEPLIPYHSFHKAIKASNNHNRKEKIAHFREITKSLPTSNYDTLKYLLQHLLRVTKYKEFNRMHIPNLAIVFGPTLMWPEQESMNMALDLMQQNLVIECFLLEFDNIFK